ncbi:MAG: hypothetical protein U1A22_06895, partial [Xanthomonadaceae bacterium]|nr:hypothetical protein [Xanthomonadaceae bacterium]
MVERTVFIHLPGETQAVPAGRLTMIEQGLQVQASTFAYGRRYVARANALPVVTDRPIGATHDRLNGATCRLRKTGLERGAVSGVLWGLGNCRFCGLR